MSDDKEETKSDYIWRAVEQLRMKSRDNTKDKTKWRWARRLVEKPWMVDHGITAKDLMEDYYLYMEDIIPEGNIEENTTAFNRLTNDALFSIMMHLEPKRVLQFLKINRRTAALTKNKNFFMGLLRVHYPDSFTPEDYIKHYVSLAKGLETTYYLPTTRDKKNNILACGKIVKFAGPEIIHHHPQFKLRLRKKDARRCLNGSFGYIPVSMRNINTDGDYDAPGGLLEWLREHGDDVKLIPGELDIMRPYKYIEQYDWENSLPKAYQHDENRLVITFLGSDVKIGTKQVVSIRKSNNMWEIPTEIDFFNDRQAYAANACNTGCYEFFMKCSLEEFHEKITSHSSDLKELWNLNHEPFETPEWKAFVESHGFVYPFIKEAYYNYLLKASNIPKGIGCLDGYAVENVVDVEF